MHYKYKNYVIPTIAIVIILATAIIITFPKKDLIKDILNLIKLVNEIIPVFEADDHLMSLEFNKNYKKFGNVIRNVVLKPGPSDGTANILETNCAAPSDNRVLGGRTIGIYAHPWLALLNIEFGKDYLIYIFIDL